MSSSAVVLITHLFVPLFFFSDIRNIKKKLLSDIMEFKKAAALKKYGVRADQEGDTVTFNAAKYLYPSWRLASLFPEIKESALILKFSTPWPQRSFKRKQAQVTKSYERKYAFLTQAIGRVLIFFVASLINLPPFAQDTIVQMLSGLGLGYVGIMLLRLFNISPFLPLAPIVLILVMAHFLVTANKNDERIKRLQDLRSAQHDPMVQVNPPSREADQLSKPSPGDNSLNKRCDGRDNKEEEVGNNDEESLAEEGAMIWEEDAYLELELDRLVNVQFDEGKSSDRALDKGRRLSQIMVQSISRDLRLKRQQAKELSANSLRIVSESSSCDSDESVLSADRSSRQSGAIHWEHSLQSRQSGDFDRWDPDNPHNHQIYNHSNEASQSGFHDDGGDQTASSGGLSNSDAAHSEIIWEEEESFDADGIGNDSVESLVSQPTPQARPHNPPLHSPSPSPTPSPAQGRPTIIWESAGDSDDEISSQFLTSALHSIAPTRVGDSIQPSIHHQHRVRLSPLSLESPVEHNPCSPPHSLVSPLSPPIGIPSASRSSARVEAVEAIIGQDKSQVSPSPYASTISPGVRSRGHSIIDDDGKSVV